MRGGSLGGTRSLNKGSEGVWVLRDAPVDLEEPVERAWLCQPPHARAPAKPCTWIQLRQRLRVQANVGMMTPHSLLGQTAHQGLPATRPDPWPSLLPGQT